MKRLVNKALPEFSTWVSHMSDLQMIAHDMFKESKRQVELMLLHEYTEEEIDYHFRNKNTELQKDLISHVHQHVEWFYNGCRKYNSSLYISYRNIAILVDYFQRDLDLDREENRARLFENLSFKIYSIDQLERIQYLEKIVFEQLYDNSNSSYE